MKEKRKKKEMRLEDLARRFNSRLSGWLGGRLPGQEEVRQNLKLLYFDPHTEERLERYYTEKTMLLMKAFAIGICAAVLAGALAFGGGLLAEGRFLPRRDTAYTRELQVEAAGEKVREIAVVIEPQKLREEESRELLEEIRKRMDTYILGENRSLEEVRSDLHLIRRIEGTPVTAEWELDSYEVLNLDGSLRSENLREEGSLVELTARLFCNGQEAVYRACARVLPPVLGPEEQFYRELAAAVEKLRKETEEEERQELPLRAQGKELVWKENTPLDFVWILVLTLLSMGLLYTAGDRELKRKTREREEQMCRDYVRIVGRLTLLLGAGSTVRNAWEMIAADYETRRRQGREELRYAYEEMAFACREMQNGVAEAKAYENFGIRCHVPAYLKLSALLEQNLKKGTKGLAGLLRSEAEEAKAWRRELARRKGEEASTRLLLPMILMLAVVMLFILVPAGMSMQA